MDMSDISKTANRKRMSSDAEKLREKVSRETAKIIKLKVAQDTAYWDLKEKLQQVEANHERLQQNMVEVQMQHEAISGQYQNELRLRPETINKVSGTREICGILEEYSERLKATVARCKADQTSLCDAYAHAGHALAALREDFTSSRHAALVSDLALRDKLERSEEREARAGEMVREAKAFGEAQAKDARDAATALAAIRAERNSLIAAIKQKSESLAELQQRVERANSERERWDAEMREMIANRERECGEVRQAAEALDAARITLEARLAEEQRAKEQLHARVQELEATVTKLQHDQAILIEEGKTAEKNILERDQMLENKESEIELLERRISGLEVGNTEKETELNRALEECKIKIVMIGELEATNRELEEKANDTENTLEALRVSSEKRIHEMEAATAQMNAELDAKTDAITRLMSDVKNEVNARSKMEEALRAARDNANAAADAERALRLRIDELEFTVKEKDVALAERANAVREIASEKEQLQEKIQGMQSTIDNIQKELKGSERRQPPERDAGDAANAPRSDAALYDFLSDTSVDADVLDPIEVRRRFEALSRGKRILTPLRPNSDQALSLSQAKEELSARSRAFFKARRFDHKAKKPKRQIPEE